jgi:tetratricopeptide (TPR) repeat protein
MKKNIFFFALALLAAACQTQDKKDQQMLGETIGSLEKQLLDGNGDASKKPDIAVELVEKTLQYAERYPQDTLTPSLLFRAADAARGAKQYGKAIQLWGQVWRNYEKHPRAPMALFLQGFTFDSDLRKADMAKKYYQQFLEKYPNDPLAPQVTQLLGVVDENPEDLVKKFETE